MRNRVLLLYCLTINSLLNGAEAFEISQSKGCFYIFHTSARDQNRTLQCVLSHLLAK